MIRLQSYFGDYFVIDEIASGGMASICLAYDRSKHRFVALKTLFSQYAKDPVFLKRLQREGDIYRNLKHPNIIELIESRCEGEEPHLVLEYIHGETMAGLIARNPDGCKFRVALRVMEDIVGALLQAHARSIIHRDLQPQNVLIDGSGVVKLFDFGIAYAEDDLVRTITGTFMGTILYASPEQSEGKEVDERSDLYSLGLVFYELLTGRRAVDGNDLGEVMEKKLKEDIVPPRRYRKDIPVCLEDMVMKLLRKNPDKRHRSVGALLEDLIDLRCTTTGDEHLRLFGSDIERSLYEGKKHFAVGRFEEALEKARLFEQRAGERARRRSDLLYLQARLYRKLGKFEKADEYYNELLNLPTARNEHLLDYATFLHEAGQLDEALMAVEPFTEGAPLGGPALGLRKVLDDEKKSAEAGELLADMPDDADPGIAEPPVSGMTGGGAPGDVAAEGGEADGAGGESCDGAVPVDEGAVSGTVGSEVAGGVVRNGETGSEHGGDGTAGARGWRGAIGAWLSRAMNKKRS